MRAVFDFNPRSPHGERRYRDATRTDERRFQSTLPARGATCTLADVVRGTAISIHAPRTGSDLRTRQILPHGTDFNPRSPHGERQINPATMHGTQGISIHAPRTGSDTAQHPDSPRGGHFNPRSPHGERHRGGQPHGANAPISIHAPRTGSDTAMPFRDSSHTNFNPRSPHGERHVGIAPTA